jgi:hypothetical protein
VETTLRIHGHVPVAEVPMFLLKQPEIETCSPSKKASPSPALRSVKGRTSNS